MIASRSSLVFIVALTIVCGILLALPSGFETGRNNNSRRIQVVIESVDNSLVRSYGVTRHGHQSLVVRSLDRSYRESRWESSNLLTGKLELDTIYKEGDRALAVLNLDPQSQEVIHVVLVGPWRLGVQLLLLCLFALFLILYAGKVGLKALLSFAVTILAIWKILVPAILHGWSPIPLAAILVSSLTAIIIFLVAGFTRKALTSFIGAASGILVTAVLAVIFGRAFRISGAIRPFAESLLHLGYGYLDLSALLYASVFIAAAGAVMDLSMDIAAAVDEIHQRHPEISRMDLVKSGMAVGRSVVGTMTTTLLFAYSSSYLTLLMVFMAQDIPLANMLNLSYISAEILTTLVGSFGLVTVAPLTAIAAGLVYKRDSKQKLVDRPIIPTTRP